MSYKVLLDGEIFCASFTEDTAILDPKVKLEANKAGSFTFRMLPDHPYYDALQLRASLLDVYQNDELIFEGVPISIEVDFWKRKKVTCEGELTFLNDSILRQLNPTHKTVSELLGFYLERHNNQMNNWKQFQLGTVTVGSGLYLNRYTNYNTTLSQIAEDLVDDLGGFLRVRHDQGVRYLDYLAASPHTSSQVIRIGKNLTDLKTNLDTLDIATVLIPLGAKTGEKAASGADKRVTVKSVNNDKDYIVSTASAYYGYIWKTKTWQDVTVPANLLTRGENYLTDAQWANLTIEASALDLGLVEADVEQFRLLDTIRVVSEPHGIDRNFILSKLEIDLNHPGSTRITLGMSASASMSSQVAEAAQEIQNTPTVIDVTAREQARQLLESATGGNIYFVYDADGVCTEIRIMDTNDPATATKIWRWNINGWGYSGDGGQTYTVAATMNGAIVADFITAGTLRGVQIIGESGTIGGWKIGTNILEKWSDYQAGTPATVYRAFLSAPGTIGGNYLAFGIEVYDWDGSALTLNSQPFRVRYDGKLIATGGDFSGKITAEEGKVAGWNIGTNTLDKWSSYQNGTPTTVYRAFMSAPGTIGGNYLAFGIEVYDWDGSALSFQSQPFRVRYDGKMIAGNAEVSGTFKVVDQNNNWGELGVNGLVFGKNGQAAYDAYVKYRQNGGLSISAQDGIDINGTTNFQTPPTIYGHASAVGTVQTASLSADKTLTTSDTSCTPVVSISLAAGTWLVFGYVLFGGTGSAARRVVTISDTSGAYNAFIRNDTYSDTVQATAVEASGIATLATTTTLYLNASSSFSASAIASASRIQAIRIL